MNQASSSARVAHPAPRRRRCMRASELPMERRCALCRGRCMTQSRPWCRICSERAAWRTPQSVRRRRAGRRAPGSGVEEGGRPASNSLLCAVSGSRKPPARSRRLHVSMTTRATLHEEGSCVRSMSAMSLRLDTITTTSSGRRAVRTESISSTPAFPWGRARQVVDLRHRRRRPPPPSERPPQDLQAQGVESSTRKLGMPAGSRHVKPSISRASVGERPGAPAISSSVS